MPRTSGFWIRCEICLLAACFLLGMSEPVGAEIYRWTDGSGRVHFTQDLSQVPADQRSAAVPAAKGPNPVQTYSAPKSRRRPSYRSASKQVHRVPFGNRGSVIWVTAKIDDRVEIGGLVDSGASFVSIPRRTAVALGYDLGADTPRIPMNTANGLIMQPIITLSSVAIGSARVENVQAVVSDTMSEALIGGAFINNFVYQVDAAQQVLVLRANDYVRSGLSEKDWRKQFRSARKNLASLEKYLDENQLTDRSRVRELNTRREQLESELEALEAAANRAGVPHAWRE